MESQRITKALAMYPKYHIAYMYVDILLWIDKINKPLRVRMLASFTRQYTVDY